MKVANQILLHCIPFYLFCLLFISCQKSEIDSNATIPGNPPTAFAGNDVIVQLPLDSIPLVGSYTSINAFDRVEWKKLSGPNYTIDNAKSLSTNIRDVQTGIYQFELTVFDKKNLSGKDTLLISVYPQNITNPGQNFVLFPSLTWIFPWYSALHVPNIYSYIPQGKPLRVYVQRGTSTNWVEATPISTNSNSSLYEYFIETRLNGGGMYTFGTFYIFYYGSDVADKPNVKVEF